MPSLTMPDKNPSVHKKGGRPKGSKNRSTILQEAIRGNFERSLKRNFADIMKVMIEKAKEGDVQMIKLLMDKVLPNAQNEREQKVSDFGIQIVINDMKSIESKPIEGEIVDED